ncbi:MAG: DNA glycosylase [Oscillospiraceae bacterium]
MKIKIKLSEFNPRKTFLCGQCFRWNETRGLLSGEITAAESFGFAIN